MDREKWSDVRDAPVARRSDLADTYGVDGKRIFTLQGPPRVASAQRGAGKWLRFALLQRTADNG
jgi:hypothetical protein